MAILCPSCSSRNIYMNDYCCKCGYPLKTKEQYVNNQQEEQPTLTDEVVSSYLSALSTNTILSLADIDPDDIVADHISTGQAIDYIINNNDSDMISGLLDGHDMPSYVLAKHVTNCDIEQLAKHISCIDPDIASDLFHQLHYWQKARSFQ